MSDHTPGPLEVRTGPHPESGLTTAEWQASLLHGVGPVYVVVAPDPERPAPDYLVTAVTGDGPAARANAWLYAAAPDLLEALRAAEAYYASLPPYPDRGHDIRGELAEIRAAIAKAEGR